MGVVGEGAQTLLGCFVLCFYVMFVREKKKATGRRREEREEKEEEKEKMGKICKHGNFWKKYKIIYEVGQNYFCKRKIYI
jgi:hypothetical protein